MQDAGENQKPETDKYYIRPKAANDRMKLAQETGNILYCHGSGERESYELRTPVRLSMRRMIRKKYSYRHIDSLYYNAACSYELQEKILEALEMYEKCHNEEGISRLLIENARKYAGNGYYWELRRYYLGLSEHMIRQSPELMAGMSLLQSILLNDEESEKWYRILCEYKIHQSFMMRIKKGENYEDRSLKERTGIASCGRDAGVKYGYIRMWNCEGGRGGQLWNTDEKR